jgi:hypothetical protein
MKLLVVKHLAKNIGTILVTVGFFVIAGMISDYLFGSYGIGVAAIAAIWFGWLIIDMSISQARWEKAELERMERVVAERLRNAMNP